MKILKNTYTSLFDYQQAQSRIINFKFKTKDSFNNSILKFSYYTIV